MISNSQGEGVCSRASDGLSSEDILIIDATGREGDIGDSGRLQVKIPGWRGGRKNVRWIWIFCSR